MNNYFSIHTVKTVFDHLPEKLAASAAGAYLYHAIKLFENAGAQSFFRRMISMHGISALAVYLEV